MSLCCCACCCQVRRSRMIWYSCCKRGLMMRCSMRLSSLCHATRCTSYRQKMCRCHRVQSLHVASWISFFLILFFLYRLCLIYVAGFLLLPFACILMFASVHNFFHLTWLNHCFYLQFFPSLKLTVQKLLKFVILSSLLKRACISKCQRRRKIWNMALDLQFLLSVSIVFVLQLTITSDIRHCNLAIMGWR